jgi:hypothetical protein
MASSSSSLKRSIEDIEPSKENMPLDKKMNLEYTSFQLQIIDMFKKNDLIAPTQLLGKRFS